MAQDPRRDSRAQRYDQTQRRNIPGPPQRQLYPVLEIEEDEPEEESRSLEDSGDVVMQRADSAGRFFAEERQETTIAVEDWNEQNEMWLALKKGDVKLIRGPDGRDMLVTKDAYIRHRGGDLLPTQDYAKPDAAVMDQSASLAQTKYELSKTLIAYAACDSLITGLILPVSTKPTQASVAVPPIGGAVLCAQLDFGHKGSGESCIFDLPPGQIVKAPFAGSFGKISARLWPKYYTNDDNNLVATTRVYRLTPGGPQLTSELWNSTPSSLMAMNGFANQRPQPCRGWVAEGIQSNDTMNRPARRFYGSVAALGLIASQPTRCPIAFASTYVMLVGGKYDSANPNLQSLQFLQNLQPTSGVATRQLGPFNVNQMIALDADCVSIDVINSPNVLGGGGAGAIELPFELIYFLSF